MKRALAAIRLAGLCSALALASCISGSPDKGATSCLPGAYTKDGATVVVYRRSTEPGSKARYTFVDGRRGELDGDRGEFSCLNGRYWSNQFVGFQPIVFAEEDAHVIAEGAGIVTRHVSAVRNYDPRPLVVFVHGSESTPTIGWSPYPYLFAAQGVDVVVYDKRGTGRSTGTYTQNFHVLADDAATVAGAARHRYGDKVSRFGYFGGSQGGWVAPLAASRTGADFLVVGFGLVLSPLEEDAEQVFEELRRAGHGQDVIAKARGLTEATGRVVASGFAEGIDQLLSVRAQFQAEPWYNMIEGEFTGDLLRASETELRSGQAGSFEDSGTSWNHDALAVLQSLDMPQYWILAGSDREAPGQLTETRLRALQAMDKPVTLAVFPQTDHGIVEFIEDDDGTRTYTRFSKGYFRLAVDAMKGIWLPPYGRAEIKRPSHKPVTGD